MIIDVMKEYVAGECKSDRNAFSPAFFDEHLAVVAKYAVELGRTLGADLEIVELAAWMHDLSAVQDFAALPRHAALSAEIARKMLPERGYPAERIERVAACIASHSVPIQIGGGSLEEVCVSNADAISQIIKPSYWHYYIFKVRQFGFVEGRDWLRQRVASHWAALIPQARALIEREYAQVGDMLRM
jgi:uncharacterized protein